MRFSAFDSKGDLLATNEYYRFVSIIYCLDLSHLPFSVGGGFVVNEETKRE